MSVLEEKCPDFFIEEIYEITKKFYDIDGTIQGLVSFDDQNFLITDEKNINFFFYP